MNGLRAESVTAEVRVGNCANYNAPPIDNRHRKATERDGMGFLEG